MYINNNDYIDKAMMDVAWTGMRIVSQLQIWYKDMFSNCCGLWNEQKNTDKYLFVVSDGVAVKTYLFSNDVIAEYNSNYDLVIFKYTDPADTGKYLYKRYDEIPDELNEDQAVKNLIIVANIKYGGRTYTIDEIESLMIPNTRIFDRSYTQWYMKHFEGLEIFDDDYSIELLDNDMKEISFDHTEYIEITSNGYKVGNDREPNTYVWRSVLTEEDISGNTLTHMNRKVTLADITSPPLVGKMIDTNTVITPLSLRSNATDVSFDIIDKSEAN